MFDFTRISHIEWKVRQSKSALNQLKHEIGDNALVIFEIQISKQDDLKWRTLLPSTHLVNITMAVICCSQIIVQKFGVVAGTGATIWEDKDKKRSHHSCGVIQTHTAQNWKYA